MRLGVCLQLAAAVVISAGCYNYSALGRSRLVPSSYLAVALTESGSDELAQYLGPGVVVVRGRYLGATERGLSLSVESVESRRGDISHWAGERVEVPGEFVQGVQQRRASRAKTFLLAGASMLGFVVGYQAFGPGSRTAAVGGSGTGGNAR